jgi:hypothetical protein
MRNAEDAPERLKGSEHHFDHGNPEKTEENADSGIE